MDQLLFSGKYDLCWQVLETLESRVAAVAEIHPLVRTWLLYVRASVAMTKDPAQYIVAMRALVASFEEVGDMRNTAFQRVNLADAYIQVGYYREAVTLSRESLAEAEDTHVLLMAASAKSNLARGLCVLGELTEARAVAEECAEEMRRASEQRMEGWVRRILVTVLLRLGELEKAAQEARRALEIPGLPPPTRAICLAHLADVFLAQGLPADADVAARSAMDLLEEIGQLDDSEAYVRLVHAQVLFASQRYDEAGRAILAARTRLSAIAASMGNAYFRESFLRDVPEHAKTLELAAAWCD